MNAGTAVRNALDECLTQARMQGAPALVMYLTAGFPDAASTRRWGPLLARSGAAIIEIGVPFSDPLGDGPTIQRSSQRALEAGMTLRGSMDLAAAIHSEVPAPIVLMSYCNPIFRMGVREFAGATAAAGATGVIVPDLPLEEAGELGEALMAAGVHLIYLLSPASTAVRIAATAKAATGFIYCMSVTGVTGARVALPEGLPTFLTRVRAATAVPLVVGFGVSRPEHLEQLRGVADGAVVASALVDLIERTPADARDHSIATFVEELHAACLGS